VTRHFSRAIGSISTTPMMDFSPPSMTDAQLHTELDRVAERLKALGAQREALNEKLVARGGRALPLGQQETALSLRLVFLRQEIDRRAGDEKPAADEAHTLAEIEAA
jgi:hypothetical protein